MRHLEARDVVVLLLEALADGGQLAVGLLVTGPRQRPQLALERTHLRAMMVGGGGGGGVCGRHQKKGSIMKDEETKMKDEERGRVGTRTTMLACKPPWKRIALSPHHHLRLVRALHGVPLLGHGLHLRREGRRLVQQGLQRAEVGWVRLVWVARGHKLIN